ncbi:hypothetical protein [Cysteiniphilum sp. G11B1]|uniref:hypothetical protein n=1 Tax=unclassified Cysteiniphilum TaxID=2610889 RepID=UPI003F838719
MKNMLVLFKNYLDSEPSNRIKTFLHLVIPVALVVLTYIASDIHCATFYRGIEVSSSRNLIQITKFITNFSLMFFMLTFLLTVLMILKLQSDYYVDRIFIFGMSHLMLTSFIIFILSFFFHIHIVELDRSRYSIFDLGIFLFVLFFFYSLLINMLYNIFFQIKSWKI